MTESSAYALAEQKPDEYYNVKEMPEGFNRRTIFNRAADIEWLKEKTTWLFETAGVPLPPFEYEQTPQSDSGPYLLAYYEAAHDEYVVIVFPLSDPMQFCRAEYQLVCALEIGNAVDYPTNVILRPNHEHLEAMIERKPAPVNGESQTVSRAQEDDWLEAAFEDRVSGKWTYRAIYPRRIYSNYVPLLYVHTGICKISAICRRNNGDPRLYLSAWRNCVGHFCSNFLQANKTSLNLPDFPLY